MTMYDGASNTSTAYATLLATADNAPSPQICSASSVWSGSYPAWQAFNQDVSGAYWSATISPTLPQSLMVDLGSGNEKLINKYVVTGPGNQIYYPTEWILQGSNTVGCAVVDAKNANGWTDLDSRTSSLALITPTGEAERYITFVCGIAYRYFRIRITAYNGTAAPAISELKLIAQVIPIEVDTSESSESTDAVSGYVAITADVSESSASTDTVDGTKDFEIEDVNEATTSTDEVSVYQSHSICDVDEASESTDSTTSTAGVDVDVSESSESTDAVECLDTVVAPAVSESSESTDAVDCLKWTGTSIEVADSIYIRDTAIYNLAILVQDTLGLADAPAAMLCLLIHDYLLAVETQTVNQSGTKSISEALVLRDAAYPALHLSIADTIALADTPTVTLCLSILEHLRFDELVTAIGRLSHGVSDTINMQDSLAFGFSQAVSEALSVVDTASVIGALLNSIAESLVLTDTATNQTTMSLPVSEALTIADTVSSQGVLYNIIYDTLTLNVTVEVDGETWECYVLNTPKFLPSVYSGFNYNSYCVFDNRAYGCKSTAIDELTGDTDNGVAFHTGIQLPDTRFGIPNQQRFQKAYVGVSGTKPKMVMQTEDGSKKVYSIDSEGEVDTSSALQGKKWKLTVTDFDTLDFIKLYPVVLSK